MSKEIWPAICEVVEDLVIEALEAPTATDYTEFVTAKSRLFATLNAKVKAVVVRAIEIGAEELEEMPGEERRTHQEDVVLWNKVSESLLNRKID